MERSTTDPTIDVLRKRYDVLYKKRIEANTNLETAAETLEALKREAREKYNTDDIADLEKMLADMKLENERKLAEYQQHLEQIEGKLAEVETQFAQGGTTQGGTTQGGTTEGGTTQGGT